MQEVWADVEQRPGTGLVEEPRVGVPDLRRVVHSCRGRAHDLADRTLVDQPGSSPELLREEGVWGTGEVQAVGGRETDQHLCVSRVVANGFSEYTVLALPQCVARHPRVRRRWGEVKDEIDVVSADQRLDGARLQAPPAGQLLGTWHVQVGAAGQHHLARGGQVLGVRAH